jgi:hypothetical protein
MSLWGDISGFTSHDILHPLQTAASDVINAPGAISQAVVNDVYKPVTNAVVTGAKQDWHYASDVLNAPGAFSQAVVNDVYKPIANREVRGYNRLTHDIATAPAAIGNTISNDIGHPIGSFLSGAGHWLGSNWMLILVAILAVAFLLLKK